MGDFISTATSTQLLFLMTIPLIGSVLLLGFLFIFFRRGRKKNQMKLGIQINSEGDTLMTTDNQPQDTTPAEPHDMLSSEEPVDLSWPAAAANPDEEDLNLDILSKRLGDQMVEPAPAETDQPEFDLTSRLGGQNPQPPPSTTVPAEMPPPPETSVPVAPTPVQTPQPAELLRLLRDPQTGRLVVEVAGHRYTKLTDIDDRETGQYILELAAHMLAFTNGVVATDAGVKSVYLPKVAQTPQPLFKPTPVTQLPDPTSAQPQQEETPPAPGFVPKPPPEAEAAFRAALQTKPPQPEPLQPKPRGFFGGLTSSSDTPALSGFSLADEINQIVQTRLTITPLPSVAKLEIISDHSGGIQINVNGTVYPTPDDIPDPQIKALIKESIKQWENS